VKDILAKRNVSWGFGGCREAVPFFGDEFNTLGEGEGLLNGRIEYISIEGMRNE
jgi:hypothetical protein